MEAETCGAVSDKNAALRSAKEWLTLARPRRANTSVAGTALTRSGHVSAVASGVWIQISGSDRSLWLSALRCSCMKTRTLLARDVSQPSAASSPRWTRRLALLLVCRLRSEETPPIRVCVCVFRGRPHSFTVIHGRSRSLTMCDGQITK